MNCSVVMSSVARRLLQSLQQVEVVAVRVLEGGHAGAPLVFPPGIDHISFMVSDVDALYGRLRQTGVVFGGPPRVTTASRATIPRAPYYKQHVFAEKIERLLATELGVDWSAYGKEVSANDCRLTVRRQVGVGSEPDPKVCCVALDCVIHGYGTHRDAEQQCGRRSTVRFIGARATVILNFARF